MYNNELAAQEQPSPVEEGADPLDLRTAATELTRALGQLSDAHREVLVLRFHEELSLEEIATVTGAPLSTVKSRLYRGLAALKPSFAEVQQ